MDSYCWISPVKINSCSEPYQNFSFSFHFECHFDSKMLIRNQHKHNFTYTISDLLYANSDLGFSSAVVDHVVLSSHLLRLMQLWGIKLGLLNLSDPLSDEDSAQTLSLVLLFPAFEELLKDGCLSTLWKDLDLCTMTKWPGWPKEYYTCCAKIVPIGIQLVLGVVPLKGQLCTLSTPKRFILVPESGNMYYYKHFRAK